MMKRFYKLYDVFIMKLIYKLSIKIHVNSVLFIMIMKVN